MGQFEMHAKSVEARPNLGAETHGRDERNATRTNRTDSDGAGNGREATHGLATSDAAIAKILEAWRTAERLVAGMAEDSPEFETIQTEIARLRWEYHQRVQTATLQQRTDGPARPSIP